MSIRKYCQEGYDYFYRGHNDKAIAELSKVISEITKPNEFPFYLSCAYAWRGIAYLKTRDYANATKDLTQAIGLYSNGGDPKYEVFSYHGWLQLLISGCFDDSESELFSYSLPEVYHGRGRAYFKSGNHRCAITDFTMAMELYPNDEDVWYGYSPSENYHGRGRVYFEQGNYNLAIKDFTKALELNPDDPWLLHRRGWAYWKKGYYARAMADHEQATVFDTYSPDEAKTYQVRWETYWNECDVHRIIADLTQAINSNPNDHRALHSRAMFKERIGESGIVDRLDALDLLKVEADKIGQRLSRK